MSVTPKPRPVPKPIFNALLVRLDSLEQRFLELRTRHTDEVMQLGAEIASLRADLERGHE